MTSTSIYRPETGDRILALALCRTLAAPHAQNTAPSTRIKIVGRTMIGQGSICATRGQKRVSPAPFNANENIRFMLSEGREERSIHQKIRYGHADRLPENGVVLVLNQLR